jgi:hypothetical protein
MSEDRTNFTMIPHIIDDLGLDVYQHRVYCAIKRAAGENGVCTKSISSLSKETRIGATKLRETIASLCEINQVMNKPLIKKKERLSKDEDSDTNLITVVDVWKDNLGIKKQNRGTSPREGGGSPDEGGVPRHAKGGTSPREPNKEPFKKNPFKKTTTTTSSSDVHKSSSSSFSDEIKKAAEAIKAWMDTQAMLPRQRKIGRHYDEVIWGKSWIIPLKVYQSLIQKYGFDYFQDHLTYMVTKQTQFDSGIRKNNIDIPETYLKKACKENYAESTTKGE